MTGWCCMRLINRDETTSVSSGVTLWWQQRVSFFFFFSQPRVTCCFSVPRLFFFCCSFFIASLRFFVEGNIHCDKKKNDICVLEARSGDDAAHCPIQEQDSSPRTLALKLNAH